MGGIQNHGNTYIQGTAVPSDWMNREDKLAVAKQQTTFSEAVTTSSTCPYLGVVESANCTADTCGTASPVFEIVHRQCLL